MKKLIFCIMASGMAAFCTLQSFAGIYKIKVTDFESVNLRIPADVIWSESGSATCILECSAEAEEKIEIVSEGQTLVIKKRGGNSVFESDFKGKIKITLAGKKLDRVDINGSGDFEMKNPSGTEKFEYNINGSGNLKADVKSNTCSGTINGSGDVTIKGTASKFDLDINGSGEVNALDFVCGSVEIEIAGSGDAKVNATENLDIKIAGSGDVSYRGNPKSVRQKVAGSGEIIKI